MVAVLPFDSAVSPFGSSPIDPVLTPASPLLHSVPFAASVPGVSALTGPNMGVASLVADVIAPSAQVSVSAAGVGGITGASLFPVPAVELSQVQQLGDVLIAPESGAAQAFVAQWTFREAKYNNEVGIFAMDGQGRVNGVEPGSPGYASAVLSSASRQVLFHSGDRAGNWKKVTLSGGAYIGFYLLPNGSGDDWLIKSRAVGGAPAAYILLRCQFKSRWIQS